MIQNGRRFGRRSSHRSLQQPVTYLEWSMRRNVRRQLPPRAGGKDFMRISDMFQPKKLETEGRSRTRSPSDCWRYNQELFDFAAQTRCTKNKVFLLLPPCTGLRMQHTLTSFRTLPCRGRSVGKHYGPDRSEPAALCGSLAQ